MDEFQKQLQRLKRNRCLLRLLTNDELKPRLPSKLAASEKLKVGHKSFWLRRSVAASRPYHPLKSRLQKTLAPATSPHRRGTRC